MRTTYERVIPSGLPTSGPGRDQKWAFPAALPLIQAQGITLVGVAVANLADARPVQLALPFDRASGTALDTAVDEVRDRFGTAAVSRAVLLGRQTGMTVPMLPD